MPTEPEYPTRFDCKRLCAAVDWVSSHSGDATAYYEQDMTAYFEHEPYSMTVYVEVFKQRGTLGFKVRRYSGMTDKELTEEAIRVFTGTLNPLTTIEN